MTDRMWATLKMFVNGSLIRSFPMTNSRWVTLNILWKEVSSGLASAGLFQWPTACEWHCAFCERQSHPTFPMTNREWVALHILWKAISSHLFLWPTASEWHCTFCKRQSHHILMTNSLWVTLHILCKAISSGLFLWPTESEWHCTLCERQSHQNFSCGQKSVSDIAHFVKGSLIRLFPMTNSKWVALHVWWKADTSHLLLWPTASEWHYTFCERQSHQNFSYDQQSVSDIAHFVKSSLITSDQQSASDIAHFVKSSLITSDQQSASDIAHFVKAFSSHLLWLTGSEWHCTFCERQSHQILSHNQQFVSDITHFMKGSLIRSFLWPTDCEWQHILWKAVITSSLMSNSLWVTLHIFWKAVSSDIFIWLPVCQWHCTFCDRQSHQIFSYDQQIVSDIAHSVKGRLITYDWQPVSDIAHFVKSSLVRCFPMTNSLWATLHMLWKAVSLDLSPWLIVCE